MLRGGWREKWIGHGGKCVPYRLILSTNSNGKATNNMKKDNWKAVTTMKNNIMKSQTNIRICNKKSN